MWPEVTDPEKFVYEDVAIAAYLLVSACPIPKPLWGGARLLPPALPAVSSSHPVLT